MIVMKNFLERTKLPMWGYKLAGTVLVSALLIFVHRIYFPSAPEYGDLPFFAFLFFIDGLWILLPYIIDKIITSIILAVYSMYYVIQMVYYSQFSQYISINGMISQYSEASEYTYLLSTIVSKKDWWVMGITILVIILLCLLRRKTRDYGRTQLMILICSSLLICTIPPYFLLNAYMKSLNLVDSSDVSYFETDSFIYDFMPSACVFVNKFGMEEFLLRDLQKNVFSHTDTNQEEMALVKEYLAENTPYETNAETGVFTGKSVILIQAESLSTFAIDPVLTPTLYQLENEGWNFENYHSPLLEGSTSTTELMSNTSLLSPNDGNTPAITYGGNAYPTSLAKLFAANGYSVDAFHNNYANYYNRSQFFPSIGYENFYDSYKLGVPNLESDLVCGKVIDWMDVADTVPYLSLWVTYSGHQDYTVDFSNSDKYGPSCAEEYTAYLNTVKQTYPNLSEELQVYMAKNMSLDRAVKDYIDTFEAQGRDDIVLVIYGDHFVKEFTDQARVDSATIFTSDRSLNQTPLIIWTPGIESRVIDKYCSSLDLLPTLCNLFGISYDRNTVFGNDIFDDRYPGFYFDIDLNLYGTGWVYSLSKHQYEKEPASNQEAIGAMVQRFMKATYISTYLFQTNYFASDYYQSSK